jgi:hypothetical protein
MIQPHRAVPMPNRLFVLVLPLAAMALTACERAEPSVFGSWTAVDPNAEWTVRIAEDSTWFMQAGDMTGDGVVAPGQTEGAVHLATTGDMASVMPGGFEATLDGDTLRLCSAAGCSDMVRDR